MRGIFGRVKTTLFTLILDLNINKLEIVFSERQYRVVIVIAFREISFHTFLLTSETQFLPIIFDLKFRISSGKELLGLFRTSNENLVFFYNFLIWRNRFYVQFFIIHIDTQIPHSLSSFLYRIHA